MLDFMIRVRVEKSKFDKIQAYFSTLDGETISKFLRKCIDDKLKEIGK